MMQGTSGDLSAELGFRKALGHLSGVPIIRLVICGVVYFGHYGVFLT